MINIVCFNGGRGASSLITSILGNPAIKLTSVVNAYDDGKSTGAIRRYFDMLGPSDLRKVQQLMLPAEDVDFTSNFWLFDFRFPENINNQRIHCINLSVWNQLSNHLCFQYGFLIVCFH